MSAGGIAMHFRGGGRILEAMILELCGVFRYPSHYQIVHSK